MKLFLTKEFNAIKYTFLFAALIFFFLFISNYRISIYDEGLILTGAFRILNGDIPSKDFYTNYGPGQFYILAYLFKIFGTNALIARIYDGAIASGIIFVTYFFLRRFHPGWYSLCCSLCVIALLANYEFPLYPINPVLLISLACAFRLRYLLLNEAASRHYLSISLGIALILLFRYDLAIITFTAFALPIILSNLIKLITPEDKLLTLFKQTTNILLVLTILPLITIILLLISGILLPALQDILSYNSSNYVAMRSLPFPGIGQLKSNPLEFIFIYFPIISSIFAILNILIVSKSMTISPKNEYWEQFLSLIVFTSLTLFFFVKGWVRTSGIHMLLANIPATILCFICAYQLVNFWLTNKKLKVIVPTRTFIHSGVWAISIIFLVIMLIKNYKTNPLYRHLATLEFSRELPPLSFFGIDPSQYKAALYIKNKTMENDKILSAPGRHDKIFVNNVLLYFITQRMPATRWHHYDPGIQTTEKIQREIINELENNKVSLIIRDSSWDHFKEPNKSAESSNVFILDKYISNKFHKELSFGKNIAVYVEN